MSGSQIQGILENSKLAVVAPDDPTADFASLLGSSNVQRQQNNGLSGPEEMPQRKTLFFDEVIHVLVVLQTPEITLDALKRLAPQLIVSLESFAVGTRRSSVLDEQDDKATTLKDLVSSWTNAEEDNHSNPGYCTSSDHHDESKTSRYAYWRVVVHLNRARIRSSNPSLYFSASVALRPESSSLEGQNDEYLPSGVPAPMNLFDAFQNDPTFNGNPPFLPASTLSKILPTGVEGRDQPSTLRSASRPLIQLAPAFRSRTRCSRIGASPNHAKVLACLDIDVSPFIDAHVKLEEPKLTLSDGVAESMGIPRDLSFPLNCKPHDSLSFIYNLVSSRRLAATVDDKLPYSLNVVVNATLVRPNKAHIPLKSTHRISVDLSVLHTKPYFLRSQKPLPPLVSQPQRSSLPSQPDHLSHLITVTISSSPTTTVGETLTWSLLLANRSSTRVLDLAIIPITHPHASPSTGSAPTTAPTATKPRHAHKPTLSTSLFTASGRPTAATASPPTSAHASSATTRPPPQAPSARDATPEPDEEPTLIPLTPDIRTGALRPGASIDTSMQFLVLRAGVVRVHAVRVVDLGVAPGREGGEAEAERRDGRPFVDLSGALLPDVVAFEAAKEVDGDEDR